MLTIRVVRERGAYGMFRALTIVVDGEFMGRVKEGQSIEIEVPDHAKKIVGKMDWGETEAVSIADLSTGGVVVFKPYFSLNLLRGMGILKLPIRVSCQ